MAAAFAALLLASCAPIPFYLEIPLPQTGGVMLDLNGAVEQDFPLALEPGPDGKVTPPARNPQRAGYQFAGWFADSAGEIPFDFANTVVTELTVVYAKWEGISWLLTFFLNDGTGGESGRQSILNGFYAVWQQPPPRADRGFAGWFTNEAGTPDAAFTFDLPVTQDKDLYAKWDTKNYYIHYSGNYAGGGIKSLPVPFGRTLSPSSLPSPETRQGYAFGGWYDTSACEGEPWTGGEINTDKTVYAKWTAQTYTVTFVKYAGSPETYTVQREHGMPLAHITPYQLMDPSDSTLESGSTLEPEDSWSKRLGWSFLDWEHNGEGWNFATPVTEDMTLVGLWGHHTFTVTLELMDGRDPIKEDTLAGETPVIQSVTRDGHELEGWYTDMQFHLAYTPEPLYRETTLYAKWTVLTYTVTFDTQEGSANTSYTAAYGTRAVPPAVSPTKPGNNNFTGWSAAAHGRIVDFTSDEAIITEETTFFAQWTSLPTYTVTFDYNGGQLAGSTTPVTQKAIEGQRIAPPAVPPMRSGYSFTGWYTAPGGGGNAVDFTTDSAAVITADKPFYAHWKQMATLTLINTCPGANTVTYVMQAGETFTLPTSAPAGSGWVGAFEGWYTNAGLTTSYASSTVTMSENKILYAKLTVTVTFTWNYNSMPHIRFPIPVSSPLPLADNHSYFGGITDSPTFSINTSNHDTRTIKVISGAIVTLPSIYNGAWDYPSQATVYTLCPGVQWQSTTGTTYANSSSTIVQVLDNVTFTAY